MSNRFSPFLVALLAFALHAMAEIKPTELKCEYLVDPQGIDMPDPRFFW